MKAPGVEVRPIKQLDGDAQFNEVFLSDVRVSDLQRLGDVNTGWRTALTTLMNERAMIGGRSGRPARLAHIEVALSLWNRNEFLRTRWHRDRLIQLWIRSEAIRLTVLRSETGRDRGTPGPEASVTKLAGAELEQDVYSFCVDLLGGYGMLGLSSTGDASPVRAHRQLELPQTTDPQRAFLRSLAATIAGGTSEIMRNILGERVLGLAGDTRVDRGLPWHESVRI
jgi:alkylation response protein AidB-like acyl-CoA dehydrogenase